MTKQQAATSALGKPIADVQASVDMRQIAIDKVGIKDIRHPVRVKDRTEGEQHTIASFNMYVNLPHNFKGTHMSRFVEILNLHEREISVQSFRVMLGEMAERLAERGLSITVTDDAKKFIAEKGFDPLYGARHLKRALQRYMDDPLAEEILAGQFAGDCDIKVDLAESKDKLHFSINQTEPAKKGEKVKHFRY